MGRESQTRQGLGAHLTILGRVQGVGFRFFTQDMAGRFRLHGWVRNLPDQSVECYAEGPRPDLEAFITELRKGPPLSRVDDVVVEWMDPAEGKHSSFSIVS